MCAGQANYGFANAAVDTLALCRKQDGLPALAIQWGPIADVGFVAEVMKVWGIFMSGQPFPYGVPCPPTKISRMCLTAASSQGRGWLCPAAP